MVVLKSVCQSKRNSHKTKFISRDTIYEVTQSLWKSAFDGLGQNLELKELSLPKSFAGTAVKSQRHQI